MSQQFELFGVDLDEFDDPISVSVEDVQACRVDLGNYLSGRCFCCGGHINVRPGHCVQCLGSECCNCSSCFQIASLHRSLQNDLYWLKRELFQDFEASMYSSGVDPLIIKERLRMSFLRNEDHMNEVRVKILHYRLHPACQEVSA